MQTIIRNSKLKCLKPILQSGVRMKENIIADKTFDFAVRVVNLHKYLISNGVDYSLAKQLLRCGQV